MIQEIITYLIIASAFGILLYNILQFFNLFGKKKQNLGKCGGCSGAGCEIRELQQLNKSQIGQKNQYRFYL